MQPAEVLAHSAGPPSPPRQPRSPVREAFTFLTFGRKKSSSSGGSSRSTLSKRSRAPPPASSPSTSAHTETASRQSHHAPGVEPSLEMARGLAEDKYPPNSTVKPVVVRFGDVAVTAQITKETSAAELLADCGKSLASLGRLINPDTSVVIEPCVRPGLERRLRQYERIWDVTSAWDHHSSNGLVILPDRSDPDGELSLSSVPKTQSEPEGFVLPLYFLQRPGKWSQRYITLKENGQIFASKKKEWKTTDKDVAKLCQLSDFDLYLPTVAEMKKQLRPPRKYCYAIRSQEKASLFLDSTHYVHFFCTDDANVSRQFRSCVHRWRSWYLVNKKLRLHEEQVSSPTIMSQSDHDSRGRVSIDQSSRARPSMDRQAPLVRSASSTRESTRSNAASGGVVPPVPAMPPSLREKQAAVFEATGLLGNGYDERKQQALRQNVAARQQPGAVTSSDDGPFIDGPNLLNSHAALAPAAGGRAQSSDSDGSYDKGERPGGWFPSATQHSADQRTSRPSATAASAASSLTRRATAATRERGGEEARERHPPLHQQPAQQQQTQRRPTSSSNNSSTGPPQPLIDLTPSFVEPPQWSREKKGRGVRAPQGKPLVDLATGPVLPGSSTTRFRDASAPPKSLIRRPEPLLSTAGASGGAGSGGSVPGGSGTTLMEQYDLRKAAGRRRGQTLALVEGEGGAASAPLTHNGLARSHTVRSIASGSAGGVQPPVPAPAVSSSAAAAAYMQARAKMMGQGEEEKERVRQRLRNGDMRGQGGMGWQ
ncbi:uncharacterized protein P884DRAFT_278430 [Thermothelomyces heterothallicus CBS 202.75]|uniref:uncharacterized protein n=1 Tax=Thermothelomyces heterothallicus CBS 202.75 TaxID=1149848 RepID=UPI00374260C2